MDRGLPPMTVGADGVLIDPIAAAAAPIFSAIFPCRMRYQDTLSDEEIKERGIFSVGHKEYDDAILNQLMTVQYNINTMIWQHNRGITVRVIGNENPRIIYEIIRKYLDLWVRYLERGLNIGGAPLKDLQDLNTFAGIVYPHAQSAMGGDYMREKANQMFGGMTITRDNLFAPIAKDSKGETKPAGDGASFIPFPSLSDFFSERIVKTSR